jgi:hypothetical protein
MKPYRWADVKTAVVTSLFNQRKIYEEKIMLNLKIALWDLVAGLGGVGGYEAVPEVSRRCLAEH